MRIPNLGIHAVLSSHIFLIARPVVLFKTTFAFGTLSCLRLIPDHEIL